MSSASNILLTHLIIWAVSSLVQPPPALPVGLPEVPRIPMGIEGTQYQALMDSGSSISMIDSGVAEELQSKGIKLLPPPDLRLFGANKSRLNLEGCMHVELQFTPRKRVLWNMLVIKGLSQPVLIGTDVMHKLNMSLNHGTRSVSFPSTPPENVVSTNRSWSIDSKAEKMIFVQTTDFDIGEEIFVEEFKSKEELILQPGLTRVVPNGAGGAIPLIVANIGDTATRVPRKWEIGKVTRAGQLNKAKLKEEVPGQQDIVYTLTEKEIRDLFPLKEIPVEHRGTFLNMLIKYRDVFSKDKLDIGNCVVLPHKLELIDPNKVVNLPPHRIPPNLQPVVLDYVDNLLKAGVIRPSTSPFNSPLMLVKKPNSDPSKPIEQRFRVCHNYTKVNSNLKVCSYPLNNLSGLVESVAAGKIFTTLDLAQGFFQQRLVDPHGASAFSVPGKGLFEYLRSPMGIASSPGMFQRLLDYCMKDLDRTFVYLDDIVASTKTYEEHLVVIEKILLRLRKYKLKISPHKAHFCTGEVNYLGYNISREFGIRPGERKILAIKNALPPTTIALVKSFLGLTGFFRKCIPRYSEIAADLNKLQKKTAEYKSGPLPESALKSFQNLKQALVCRPCLIAPDFSKPFILTVDTSQFATGAVLSQISEKGFEQPVAFASKLLNPAQSKKSAFEREKLGVRFALRHFRVYVQGAELRIRVDHMPLLFLNKGTLDTLDSVSADIYEFKPFTVEYCPGEKMPADFLSRAAYNIIPYKVPRGAKVVPEKEFWKPYPHLDHVMPLLSNEELRKYQDDDPEVQKIKKQLLSQGMDPLRSSGKKDLNKHYRLNEGVLMDMKQRVIIPDKMRALLLYHCHDKWGHPGIRKQMDLIQNYFIWPSMTDDIKTYIKSCERCALAKPPLEYPASEMGKLLPATYFNEAVYLDCLTNLPASGATGHTAVLVIVDSFSGYILARGIKSPTSKEVLRVFMDYWVSVHGPPASARSDGGSELHNAAFKQATEALQIQYSTSSSGRSTGNAPAERAIRSINTFLRLYISKASGGQSGWEQFLQSACLIANVSQNTRGFSPLFIMTGTVPRMPWAQFAQHRPLFTDNAWTDHFNILAKTAKMVEKQLLRIHEANKRYKKAAWGGNFFPGDVVYLYKKAQYTKKLECKQLGPFIVISADSPPYLMIKGFQANSIPFRVHRDTVKKGAHRPPFLIAAGPEAPQPVEHGSASPGATQESARDEDDYGLRTEDDELGDPGDLPDIDEGAAGGGEPVAQPGLDEAQGDLGLGAALQQDELQQGGDHEHQDGPAARDRPRVGDYGLRSRGPAQYGTLENPRRVN